MCTPSRMLSPKIYEILYKVLISIIYNDFSSIITTVRFNTYFYHDDVRIKVFSLVKLFAQVHIFNNSNNIN